MTYDVSSVLSLISRIHSESAAFLQERMAVQGLPALVSSHGFILFCLSRFGSLTMGELSEKINRDKSTTTALVKKLAVLGLVSIDKNNVDCRCKIISLTEAGKSYTCITDKISKQLLETAWKGFSNEEKESVLNLLLRMSNNIASEQEKDKKRTTCQADGSSL